MPGTGHAVLGALAVCLVACGSQPGGGPPGAPPGGGAAAAPASAGSATAAPASSPTGSSLVSARLLAGVDRLHEAGGFELAVALEIAAGYHIYWINPGETGLATEVRFRLPAGFRADPPRFPGPHRFESAGGVVGYGYQGEVLISSRVEVPGRLAPGPHELAVEVDYLACREDECVPGKVEAGLTIEAETEGRMSRQVNAELLAAHDDQVPLPLRDLSGATAVWSQGSGGPVLTVTALSGELAYFPSVAETPRLRAQTPRGKGALEISFKPGTALKAAGVLAVTEGGRTRYFQLDHPDGSR